jgi:selenide, water dikinase
VLGGLSVPIDERVLVDYRTADDAGVYRLGADRALVQTVDFFTPIVDDPVIYGRIAAANALSDVYAMGGRPLTALAIAGFPKDLEMTVLASIFSGGLEMLSSAGVSLLGGHTVQDEEIKFGYAVTGEIHPDRIWRNAGARPGDVVLLTKPIGTGIIATALKAGRASDLLVEAAIVIMLRLNRDASEVLQRMAPEAVHACTDVTGFGLLGHACEVAAASGVTIEIASAQVPIIDGVPTLVPGNVPGGGRTNADHFGPDVHFVTEVRDNLVQLLYDPQTSGGLLVSVEEAHADAAEAALTSVDPATRRIGRVLPRRDSLIVVR